MVGHLMERVQVFGPIKSKWLPVLAHRFPPGTLPLQYGGPAIVKTCLLMDCIIRQLILNRMHSTNLESCKLILRLICETFFLQGLSSHMCTALHVPPAWPLSKLLFIASCWASVMLLSWLEVRYIWIPRPTLMSWHSTPCPQTEGVKHLTNQVRRKGSKSSSFSLGAWY